VTGASEADRIPLAQPDLGPEEEAEVLATLHSGRLSLGPKVGELESALAAFTDLPWAAAVSSGTAGLHLAVRVLGLGPDDCVVTSSFSFIASANCIRYEGAEPVFVDIDPETLCLSPESLAKYLASCHDDDGSPRDPETGRRVAGVVSVDAFGHPADLASIASLVRPRGMWIVSDSCEALGSRTVDGDHAGARADLAVLAFYPNKQITTGEGGAILGRDPALRDRIDSLRNQGRRPGDPWLHHDVVGFNYRMDELSAAVGVAQMRRVDDILSRRAEVAEWYGEALDGLQGVDPPGGAGWARPAWFVYGVRVDSRETRDALLGYLNRHGVESKAYFEPPIHEQPPYRGPHYDLPATEDAARRTLILPFFSQMTREQVARVAETLAAGLRTAE
jgi:dTDP-4-amino-4,6-dideoxygalactose transaminase